MTFNHSLVCQAEQLLTGENTHDANHLILMYYFCKRVFENRYKGINKLEKKLWLKMTPIYENAIQTFVNSKGKIITDTDEHWHKLKKQLGITGF